MNEPLKDAILNGLYDPSYPGHNLFGPKLLKNDSNDKIWLTLRRELLTCKSFVWAVAFVTEDMLVPLKLVLADLATKKVSGTLITGSYLGFNSPKVFEELLKIPNLTVLINEENFHAKGYFFEHEDYQTLIIGSANLTRNALLSNYEWSLKVSSRENAALTREIGKQITDLSAQSFGLTKDWIEQYRQTWSRPVGKYHKNISQEIIPNQMQKAALKNLHELVVSGQNRGLVVSATGTGKTYLGAFAVKDFKPKRFLYLVHRQQIAEKVRDSFYQVIGGDKKEFSLLSGNSHRTDGKYLFATVQTMSQDSVLTSFKPDEFDYILIDEAHRSASPSYRKVMQYFKPKFYLGMTATPERMDKQDVYQIFDYNLAYEIRLRDALEEKMLTPFHYVGVQDYELDGELITETSKLRQLTAEKRVRYVLEQIGYYGYCGNRACGLVFCSRQDEARIIAEKFTKSGHPAAALTNKDSQNKRQKVVAALENGDLEYIMTVDLFNEGVDIPKLNQIIMLRNTQSSIVFIQQLGRGLRKYPHKDFVTVIDFIGNYKNNYLIPIALNGDRSRDKDIAITEAKLPSFVGLSTINFSRIATEQILTSLDKIKLDSLRELKAAYTDLKQKIGRIPLLQDFQHYGSISPIVFEKNKQLSNYGVFLQKMGENVEMTKYESQLLTFVTKELMNGKRPHELILLKLLLERDKVSEAQYLEALDQENAYHDEAVLKSIDDVLTLSFFDVKAGKTTKKAQYGNLSLISHCDSGYQLSSEFSAALKDSDFAKLMVDVITTGLDLTRDYNATEQFTLYKQYDREDVCRLLNWPKDVSAPMYGYRVSDHETPIFITYKKDSEKKRNAVYDNSLQNSRSLRWYTRSPRHLDSAEVQKLLKIEKMRLHIFVKRSDAAGKEFFYLGQAQIQKDTVKEEQIGTKKKAAVGMDLLLKTPLSESMYELLFDE